MAIDRLNELWQNGAGKPPDETETSKLLSGIRAVRNTYWRRNLLTLTAFIVVLAAMGYFVRQLNLQQSLSHVGVILGAVAMTLILVLKWLRQSGLSAQRFQESNIDFLKRAANRLRYSKWVLSWGVILYMVLFGAAFGMIFPELFAGRELKIKVIGLVAGYGYLGLMAWQGIRRAKREYQRDVAPLVQSLEEAAARMEAQ